MADNISMFMELTASIVSAYVRHNSVPSGKLPALIGQVHTALARIERRGTRQRAQTGRPKLL